MVLPNRSRPLTAKPRPRCCALRPTSPAGTAVTPPSPSPKRLGHDAPYGFFRLRHRAPCSETPRGLPRASPGRQALSCPPARLPDGRRSYSRNCPRLPAPTDCSWEPDSADTSFAERFLPDTEGVLDAGVGERGIARGVVRQAFCGESRQGHRRGGGGVTDDRTPCSIWRG